MLFRIAAEAPPGVMDFQSVEIVDMRLSTASLHRLLFSSVFALVNFKRLAAENPSNS